MLKKWKAIDKTKVDSAKAKSSKKVKKQDIDKVLSNSEDSSSDSSNSHHDEEEVNLSSLSREEKHEI